MTDRDVAAIVASPAAVRSANELGPRAGSAISQAAESCSRAGELQWQAERVQAETMALRQSISDAPPRWQPSRMRQELLQQSAYARLVARLETMPVIEQAKGIIMAQSCCGEAEAFDVLRRASQRSNVPVRELAAQIVAKVTETATSHAADTGQRPGRNPGRARARRRAS